MTKPNSKPKPGVVVRSLGVLGILLYLLVGAVPYFGSPLVVPFPWVFVLWTVWLAGLIPTILVYRLRPAWTLIIPPAALAFWVAFVQVGSWLFGWAA